jgi:pyridinium-3,5-bisthiocarboxylic acid mononucleotide nickel chelatase
VTGSGKEMGSEVVLGRHAVFDPFAGISGDMVLGTWIDLGLGTEWLTGLADRLGLHMRRLEAHRVMRAGLSATRVVVEPAGGEAGGHGRSWARIRELLESAELEESARPMALGAFARLAAAEARVHGVDVEAVHFHEVGAADAILDICAAAEGFHRLGLAGATTRPVCVGRGTVRIAHGTYPLPAPATAYLLEGIEIRTDGYEGECTTPTGAALLAEMTGGAPARGDLVLERVGYGAGSRDPEDHPNCLRVWVGRAPARDDTLVVLQADVDDLSPEYAPQLIEACVTAGALDASVGWRLMKKGRPAWRLEALVRARAQRSVEEAIFRHATTLGIRGWSAFRRVLPRRIEAREWRGHRIRVKLSAASDAAEGPWTGKPEHDDVVAAAAREGMAPRAVLRALREAWPDLA